MSLGGTERLQNSIHQGGGGGRDQTYRSLVRHVKSYIEYFPNSTCLTRICQWLRAEKSNSIGIDFGLTKSIPTYVVGIWKLRK